MTGRIVLEICTLLILITSSEGLTGGGVVKAALKAGRLAASESDSEEWSPSAYPKKVQHWLLPDMQEAEKLRAEQAAAMAAALEGPSPHGRAQTSSTMSFTSEHLFPGGLAGGTAVVSVPQLVLPGPRPQFAVPALATTSTAAPTTSTALASTASTSSAATSAAARSTADATTSLSSPSTISSSTATEGSSKVSTTSGSSTSTEAAVLSAFSSPPAATGAAPGASTTATAVVSTSSGSLTGASTTVSSPGAAVPAVGSSTAGTPGIAAGPLASSTTQLAEGSSTLAALSTSSTERVSQVSSPEVPPGVGSPVQTAPGPIAEPPGIPEKPRANPPFLDSHGITKGELQVPSAEPKVWERGLLPFGSPTSSGASPTPFNGSAPEGGPEAAPLSSPLIAEASGVPSPASAIPQSNLPSPAALKNGVQTSQAAEASEPRKLTTSVAPPLQEPIPPGASVLSTPSPPEEAAAKAPAGASPQKEAAASTAPAVAASPQAQNKAWPVTEPLLGTEGRTAEARAQVPMAAAASSTGPEEANAAAAGEAIAGPGPVVVGPEKATAANGAPPSAIPSPLHDAAAPVISIPPGLSNVPAAAPSSPRKGREALVPPPGLSNAAPGLAAAAPGSPRKGREALVPPPGLANAAPGLAAAAPGSPRTGPEALLPQPTSSTTPDISIPPGLANVAAAAPGSPRTGPEALVPPPGLSDAALGLAAAAPGSPRTGPEALVPPPGLSNEAPGLAAAAPRKGPAARPPTQLGPEAAPVATAKARQPEEPLLGLSGSPGHADLGPVAPPGNVTGNATGFEGEKQEEQSSVIVDGMNVTTIVKVVTKVVPLSTTEPARYGG